MSSIPDFVAHTPPPNDRERWHELKEHLTDVANGTAEFASKLGAERLGYYAGLWHDLGKYNPEFQKYLRACHTAQQAGKIPKSEKIPHAVYGAILADEICPSLAALIYGHHAGLPNYADLESKLNKPQWQKTYRQIIKQAEIDIARLKPEDNLEDTLTQKHTSELSEEVFTRLLFSCLIDADRLDTEKFANLVQFQQREERANTVSIGQLWETFQQKQQEFIPDSNQPLSEVNQVRQEVYQRCLDAAEWKPGVFRLCVPTGGGKTRSGLAFALKHAVDRKLKDGQKSRVIFAVPYTSIIEQTVKVYREDIFGKLGESAVLEHHSSVRFEKINLDLEKVESEEVGVNARVQAKLATQNWDAPLIVTTTVQLFESLFSHKTGKCRKLHNLVICGEHRRAVLAEVKQRLELKKLCTLVSTQVIEAGVDVDFPIVFRALGPLDRIVQAAGRCNREGELKSEDSRVVIFDPSEGSKPPEGEYAKAMQKTRSIFQDPDFQESQLHKPDIFQQYFRYLYSVCKPDEKGIQAMRKDRNFRNVSENFKLIEDNTVPVIIEYDETVSALLREIERRGLWSSDRAKLQPYMVNLPHYVFSKTTTTKEIAADVWQWTGSYDPIYGISWDEKDIPVYGFLSF